MPATGLRVTLEDGWRDSFWHLSGNSISAVVGEFSVLVRRSNLDSPWYWGWSKLMLSIPWRFFLVLLLQVGWWVHARQLQLSPSKRVLSCFELGCGVRLMTEDIIEDSVRASSRIWPVVLWVLNFWPRAWPAVEALFVSNYYLENCQKTEDTVGICVSYSTL